MTEAAPIGSPTLAEVIRVYSGSDGDATKALYAKLEQLEPLGMIAVQLMRAQKASARAKVYRGGARGRGSYRAMAYARKGWALGELCTALAAFAPEGWRWGWGEDNEQPWHPWVLYLELPTGQVSFHSGDRGAGPDYPGSWDGVRGVSADRILRWVGRLLAASLAIAPAPAEASP